MATAIDKELQERLARMTQADTAIDNFPTWDYKKDAPLSGDVQKVKETEVIRRGKTEDTRLAIVSNAEGTFTLWESASLGEFFDALEPGMFIYVEFIGMESLPNGNQCKMFKAFYE